MAQSCVTTWIQIVRAPSAAVHSLMLAEDKEKSLSAFISDRSRYLATHYKTQLPFLEFFFEALILLSSSGSPGSCHETKSWQRGDRVREKGTGFAAHLCSLWRSLFPSLLCWYILPVLTYNLPLLMLSTNIKPSSRGVHLSSPSPYLPLYPSVGSVGQERRRLRTWGCCLLHS